MPLVALCVYAKYWFLRSFVIAQEKACQSPLPLVHYSESKTLRAGFFKGTSYEAYVARILYRVHMKPLHDNSGEEGTRN